MAIPKPNKKGFDFTSAFKQSLDGESDISVQGKPAQQKTKDANGFDFAKAFNKSIKKKDGSDVSNGLDQSTFPSPLPNGNVPTFDNSTLTPANKAFDVSEILQNRNGNINTPDGATIPFKNKPDQFQEAQLQGVQDRILQKTATPLDIQNIATLSGKSEDATKAYLTESQRKGSAIENVENTQNAKVKLSDFINKFNSTYGTYYVPENVLSSSDKIFDFLELAKKKTLQSSKDIPLSSDSESNIKQLGLQFGMQDITDEMTNQLVQKTIQEDKINNISKDQTLTKIAEKLNPKDFQRTQKIVSNYNEQSYNPIAILGKSFDNTKREDELLNYQRGIAEVQYNNGLRQNAIDDISKGILVNDQNLINSGQQDLAKVDDNVIEKYPSLLKQEIARRVNNAIAQESGVVEGSETGNWWNHIIGATKEDYAQKLNEMGYLSNPNTKDAAMDLLSHPSLFSDNSMLGGMASNFLQPFKDLGMSVADITGFRNSKNILADKIQDEIFTKDFSQNKGDELQLKPHVRISRTIANTTANLAGMLAIATVTEGAATGLGASAKVAQRLGAYTSFGLPSFDASLKDSKNFIDSEPAQYLYASINSIANAEGGRLLDLGKITRIPGVSDEFAKLATNLSEKDITESATKELLEGAKNKYVDFAVKYGTNVTKGAATMAYFNIANNITKLAFADPNTTLENILPQAGHAFLDGVLGMSIMGGFGAVADMRNEKNTTYKGTIYNMAVNYDAAKDVFDIGLKNGTYSKPEYDQKVQILNTARAAKNALDATEQETGIDLTQDQKAVYVANKTVQAVLKNKSEQAGLPEETKNKYLAQTKKLAEQSTQILDGLKFTPTLEPLYDLYEAEKNYNQAKENLNPNDQKTETELLKAKDIYENLYSDYLKNNSSPSIKTETNGKENVAEKTDAQGNTKENYAQSNGQNEVLKQEGAGSETVPFIESTSEQGKELLTKELDSNLNIKPVDITDILTNENMVGKNGKPVTARKAVDVMRERHSILENLIVNCLS